MKTLIIVVHPKLTESMINKKWLDELLKYHEKYTVHQLHKSYPGGNIDDGHMKESIKVRHSRVGWNN